VTDEVVANCNPKRTRTTLTDIRVDMLTTIGSAGTTIRTERVRRKGTMNTLTVQSDEETGSLTVRL
jgi:hypothetical protein